MVTMKKLFLLLLMYACSIHAAATTTTSTTTTSATPAARLSHLQPGAFNRDKATLKELCCFKIAQFMRNDLEQNQTPIRTVNLEQLPMELREAIFAHAFIQEILCPRPIVTNKKRAGKKLILEELIKRYPSELQRNPTSPTFYSSIFDMISQMEGAQFTSLLKGSATSHYRCNTCYRPMTVLGIACDTACQAALQAALLYNQWDEPTELLERSFIHKSYSVIKQLPIVGITAENRTLLLAAVDNGDLKTIREMVDPHPDKQKIYRYLVTYALVERNINVLAALTDINDLDTDILAKMIDAHPNKQEIYTRLFGYAVKKDKHKVIDWMIKTIFKDPSVRRKELWSNNDFFKLLFSGDRLKIKSIVDLCSIHNELIFYGLTNILSTMQSDNLPEQELRALKDSLKNLQEKTDRSLHSPLEAMVLLVKEYIRDPNSTLERPYCTSKMITTAWKRIKTSRILSYIFEDEVKNYTERTQR